MVTQRWYTPSSFSSFSRRLCTWKTKGITLSRTVVSIFFTTAATCRLGFMMLKAIIELLY